MLSESFPFARIQYHDFVCSWVSKQFAPLLFDCRIHPHKLEMDSSVELGLELGIQLLELVFHLFWWLLVCQQNDAENSFIAQADVLRALVVHFREWFGHPLFCGWWVKGTSSPWNEDFRVNVQKLENVSEVELLAVVIKWLFFPGFDDNQWRELFNHVLWD